MLDALVLSHSVADAANAPSPTLICSWKDGGLDAAWVQVAGCSGDLEIGDMDQVESAVAPLARLGDKEHVL